MTMETIPRLFIKSGCPWCIEAEEYLTSAQIQYQVIDVRSDPLAFEEMIRLSGQTKAPTLEWHGVILADFGVEELKPFLDAQTQPTVPNLS